MVMLKPWKASDPITPRSHEGGLREAIYGIWTCANGRHVMFNRSYQPVFERAAAGAPAEAAAPGEWVEHIGEAFFYDDSTSPRRNAETREKLRSILAEWGIADYPETAVGGKPRAGSGNPL